MKWKKPVNISIQVLISILVLLIIFQPDIHPVTILNEHAMWIIISLIVIGLISMFYNNKNLIYFSMLSAAILTFYLKDLSNENLVFNSHANKKTALHLLHINIFNVEESKPELLDKIIKINPDIISFEELSPDWNKFLIKNLNDKYKNILNLNRLDFDSKLILSKYEFISKDTFLLSNHPQLDITVFFRNNPIKIIFSYILPYSMVGENINSEYQLYDLAEYVKKSRNSNIIVVGEFNQVYWTKRIRNFLYETQLNNARRSISFSKRNPYDHIFYSNRLKCIELNEIHDSKKNHIGIEGFFKITDPDDISIRN